MDIVWTRVTLSTWNKEANSYGRPLTKIKELSHEDIDQWSNVYLCGDKLLRLDTIELSDETGEDVTYRHYYYKGLIR